LLTARRETVAVAESSTGGLIGHLLTEVPGSSAVFPGGVIAYAGRLKERLGVPAAVLARDGSVSAATAEAMAEGTRTFAGAEYGLAETGIAGPMGGTDGKRVGLWFVALASAEGTVSREFTCRGNRSQNKKAAAQAALGLLVERLLAVRG
jgi:nicotinamide-nucleotide amidase